MKKALITGITGQDGSYLAELLLSKGYEVHGIIRRSSTFNTTRIDNIYVDPLSEDARLYLHYGDLSDSSKIFDLIYSIKPDEIYNLGAQSHVQVSFDVPEYTGDITALGTIRILEAIRRSGNGIKFYQASSSEMFGGASPPQNESTQFMPRSPYACAKAYSYWVTKNYRDAYKVFACNGILFNHESPRRGETFVTRKITGGIASILSGKDQHLYLGNLSAKRDWGFSPEYVEFMWGMLQNDHAEDFVIGTGEAHSVKEFLDAAFSYVGLDVEEHVKIDKRHFRPMEVDSLLADPGKARRKLKWKHLIAFGDLVKIMVDADMRTAGLQPVGEGDQILKDKFPNRWWQKD